MPIKLAPTTTIKQIAIAAHADAKGRQGDKDQLSLYVAPGRQELSFYPQVQPAAGGASGDVREALTAAIQAELCTDVGWSRNPGYARVHAEEILQHVLGEGPTANPTLGQLLDLCSKTRDIATYVDRTNSSREVVEIWANASARSAASAGPYKGLAELEPWHRGVSVLRNLEALDQMSRRPEGVGVKLWGDLEAIVKFLCLEKVVFPQSTNIKRYGPETEQRLASTPVLQYAVLEFAGEALNTRQPAFNVNRFARLLPLMSEHACQPVFVDGGGYALLKSEVTRLCRGQDRQWLEQMQRKMHILGRNAIRFDAFLRSSLSRVPALLDHVSVEFQVTMFERLTSRFDPLLCTDKALMSCDVVRAFQARWKAVPDVPLAVRLQSSLAELVAGDDDASQTPRWGAAAADVEAAFSSQLDHIYAYEDVIAKLHDVLLSRANGKLTQPTSLKLAILQKNASRMEAFLQSGISRLPQFDDVDRALLIPWWAAVKHMLAMGSVPDQAHEAVAETPVVMHTADVPVEEPVESGAALPISTTGVSPGSTSVPASASLPQGPQPGLLTVDTPSPPTEREAKHAPDASLQRPSQPNQAAPQVFLRPAQLLPSANPLRTDRPPTGKERARRNSRSDHHDSSKAKWLSAEVRRFRAARADLAAIPESKV